MESQHKLKAPVYRSRFYKLSLIWRKHQLSQQITIASESLFKIIYRLREKQFNITYLRIYIPRC